MDILQQFGVGASAYTFQQDKQVSFNTNFADTLQQSVRVIGKDGALSPYGTGRAPAEMGNVSCSFIIEGNNSFDVASQVTKLRGLPYVGQAPLFIRHANGQAMWTWALCSSVRTSQNVSSVPHLRQRVEMTFQCQDSKWYTRDGLVFFNDGYMLVDLLKTPVIKLDRSLVGDTDTVTVTNDGNAPVAPYIRWDIPTGVTCSNPKLTWANLDGSVIYSVLYTADLVAGDVVIIDCSDQRVSPTYSNLTVTHGAWLEIAPGAQTLTVSGTFSADVNLTIDFPDGWV